MTHSTADYVNAAVRQFDEEMNRVGFRTRRCGEHVGDWEWSGRVGPAGESVTITLDDHYPFSAPLVALPDWKGRSDWHQTASVPFTKRIDRGRYGFLPALAPEMQPEALAQEQ